jgi:hypothetical protein
MTTTLIVLGLMVWFVLTVVGFYLLSFWFDMNLFRFGWELVAFLGVAYVLVVGLLDVFFVGYLEKPPGLYLAMAHVTVIFAAGINHMEIRDLVKYPYRE